MFTLGGFAPYTVTYIPSPKGIAEEVAVLSDTTHGFKANVEDASLFNPLNQHDLRMLRAMVVEQAPQIFSFAQTVKIHLLQGAMAVHVEKLGLQDLPLELRQCCLFVLGCLLGEPTATDPRERRVLWDVKARPLPPGHFATFSEHDREARFHTDTQYYPNPERFFFLYSYRTAKCGGGQNFFASGSEIINKLVRTKAGLQAFSILSSVDLPFRIPSTFAMGQEPDYTWAPIISALPLVRYREDTLFDGEARFPELPWQTIRDAVAEFHAVAERLATATEALPDDGIVFVNNHEALHARTPFTDQDRHLIRVRLHA
ncbi:MAG: TauD/TfdA family dioxygenase [Acidocella sp.]